MFLASGFVRERVTLVGDGWLFGDDVHLQGFPEPSLRRFSFCRMDVSDVFSLLFQIDLSITSCLANASVA